MQGKESHLVAEADKTSGAGDAVELPTAEQMASSRWILNEIALTIHSLREQLKTETTAAAHKRMFDVLKEGHKLAKEIGGDVRDMLERLADDGFLAQQDFQLDACEAAIDSAEGLSREKKRALIQRGERTRGLQKRAKANSIAAWAYIGQDDETGAFFKFAPVHRRIWAAFNSGKRGVLVMVHPGVGKSVLLRGYMLMSIVEDPTRRFLLVFGTKDKASATVRVLRDYIRSPRFRALFPHIRILGRMDGATSDKYGFSVNRPNWNARDATVKAASPDTPSQGDSIDTLIFDDYCTEDVAHQETERKNLNFKFFNVFLKRLRKRARAKARGAGTPWHEQDTLGRIEERVNSGQWPEWTVCKLAVQDDPATGKAIAELWPEEFTTERYEAEKSDPETNYGLLFRLDAQRSRKKLVSRVWYYPSNPQNPAWRTYTPEQVETYTKLLDGIEKRGEHWLSIDPSGTSAKHSTETAVSHIVLSPLGPAYVRDCWFSGGDAVGLKEFVLRKIAGPELFDMRYSRPEEDDALRDRKFALAKAQTRATGNIHYVLIEEQGSQKAGADLFRHDLHEDLRRMGIEWGGGVLGFVTQGPRGGQQIGKLDRLSWTAGRIQGAAIKFRGHVYWDVRDRRRKFAAATDDLTRLVSQILEPVGLLDGLDTITQFLIQNWDRVHEPLVGERDAGLTTEPTSPMQLALRKLMKQWEADAGRPGNDEMGKELEWARGFSQQQQVA